MIQGISAVLCLVLAFNAYRLAKRRGIWSWSKCFILVIAIVVFPFLLIVPLSHPRLSAVGRGSSGDCSYGDPNCDFRVCGRACISIPQEANQDKATS